MLDYILNSNGSCFLQIFQWHITTAVPPWWSFLDARNRCGLQVIMMKLLNQLWQKDKRAWGGFVVDLKGVGQHGAVGHLAGQALWPASLHHTLTGCDCRHQDLSHCLLVKKAYGPQCRTTHSLQPNPCNLPTQLLFSFTLYVSYL